MDELQNKDKGLVVNDESIKFITEGSKWAKFLAILGFIGVGLMAIGGLFIGLIFSVAGIVTDDFPFPIGPIFTVLYLGLAVLYFFPVLYLFQYSIKSKRAVEQSNSNLLTEGFKYLKQHYKYLGIMMIVIFGIYILALIVALFAGLFALASNF